MTRTLLAVLLAALAFKAGTAFESRQHSATAETLLLVAPESTAEAQACTFQAATDRLNTDDDFLGWWAAAADNNTGSLALGHVVYQFAVYDWPREDDRWTVEGRSWDAVACGALDRVYGNRENQ